MRTALTVLVAVLLAHTLHAQPRVFYWTDVNGGFDPRFNKITRMYTVDYYGLQDPSCMYRYVQRTPAQAAAVAYAAAANLPSSKFCLMLEAFGEGSANLESVCASDLNNSVQLFFHPSDQVRDASGNPVNPNDPQMRRTPWFQVGKAAAVNWIRDFIIEYDKITPRRAVPDRLDFDVEKLLRDVGNPNSYTFFMNFLVNDPRFATVPVEGFGSKTLSQLYSDYVNCLPGGVLPSSQAHFRRWYDSVCYQAQAAAFVSAWQQAAAAAVSDATNPARPQWQTTVNFNMSNWYYVSTINDDICNFGTSATALALPPFARREWRDPFDVGADNQGGISPLTYSFANAFSDHAPVFSYVRPSHRLGTETTAEASLREYRDQLDSILQSPGVQLGSIVPWIGSLMFDGPQYPSPAFQGWDQGLSPMPIRQYITRLFGLCRSRGANDFLFWNHFGGLDISTLPPSHWQQYMQALTDAYGWNIANAFVQRGGNARIVDAVGTVTPAGQMNLWNQLHYAEFNRVVVDAELNNGVYTAQLAWLCVRQDNAASKARLMLNAEFGVAANGPQSIEYVLRGVRPGSGVQDVLVSGTVPTGSGPRRVSPSVVVTGTTWLGNNQYVLAISELESSQPFVAWFDLAQTLGERCPKDDLVPADFNHDGVISPCDHKLFTTRYSAADVAADVNCDGSVNAQDLTLFNTWYGNFSDADVDRDGSVDLDDLCWFRNLPSTSALADFNCNGVVDASDQTAFEAAYLAAGGLWANCGQ